MAGYLTRVARSAAARLPPLGVAASIAPRPRPEAGAARPAAARPGLPRAEGALRSPGAVVAAPPLAAGAPARPERAPSPAPDLAPPPRAPHEPAPAPPTSSAVVDRRAAVGAGLPRPRPALAGDAAAAEPPDAAARPRAAAPGDGAIPAAAEPAREGAPAVQVDAGASTSIEAPAAPAAPLPPEVPERPAHPRPLERPPRIEFALGLPMIRRAAPRPAPASVDGSAESGGGHRDRQATPAAPAAIRPDADPAPRETLARDRGVEQRVEPRVEPGAPCGDVRVALAPARPQPPGAALPGRSPAPAQAAVSLVIGTVEVRVVERRAAAAPPPRTAATSAWDPPDRRHLGHT